MKKLKKVLENPETDFDIFGEEVEQSEESIPDETTNELTLFEICNDISQNGGTLVSNYFSIYKKMPKNYNQFMINRFFGNFRDTLSMANFFNLYNKIPDYVHFITICSMLPKRKRFAKWFKEIQSGYPLELLARYYNCSVNEMKKNIGAFDKDFLASLVKKLKLSEEQGEK